MDEQLETRLFLIHEQGQIPEEIDHVDERLLSDSELVVVDVPETDFGDIKAPATTLKSPDMELRAVKAA